MTGEGGAAASMASTRPSTNAMGPPCDAVCVASTCSSCFSQARCCAASSRVVAMPGTRLQRPHPAAQSELAQQPDEAHQVAARAGAAGKVEFARLRSW